MTHIERQEFVETLNHEKEECRREFLSQRHFFRSILAGIATIVGISLGIITWAISDAAATSAQTEQTKSNTTRIDKLEVKIDINHRETMKALTDIKETIQ